MSDHWKVQPRVPAGCSEGGQWTVAGFSAARSAGIAKDEKYFPKSSEQTTNALFVQRMAMNRILRGESYENTYNLDIEGTMAAFEKAFKFNTEVLPAETVMYRGVPAKVAKKMRKLSEYSEPGYTFLTTDKSMAQKYAGRKGVVLTFIVPKGQEGIWGLEDQHEFILPRNTKLKLVKEVE